MRILIIVLLSILCACSCFKYNRGYIISLPASIDQRSAALMIEDMKNFASKSENGDQLTIFTDSIGGDVIASTLIMEMINSSKEKGIKVVTVCRVICASMAAIIFEMGDDRQMLSTARLLFHHIYYTNGAPPDADLKSHQKAIFRPVIDRFVLSEDDWAHLFETEKDVWFDAVRAKKMNLADRTISLELQDI